MAKKKKKKGSPSEAAGAAAGREPQFAARPFAGALGSLKKQLAEAASTAEAEAGAGATAQARPGATTKQGKGRLPSASSAGDSSLSRDDKDALKMAMSGVAPLPGTGKGRVARSAAASSRTAGAAKDAADAEGAARARLDALVAGDVRFHVERDGEFVQGLRLGRDRKLLRELERSASIGGGAGARCDLHGLYSDEASKEVTRFVREAERGGRDRVLIIHGKGHHSEGGVGVLGGVVVEALTQAGAAPCVLAFCSAPDAEGGSGALRVKLGR